MKQRLLPTTLLFSLALPVGCGERASPTVDPEVGRSRAAAYRARYEAPTARTSPERERRRTFPWTLEPEPPPPPPPPPEDPPPITVPTPEPRETPVGTVEGEASVSPTGQLGYSIPIVVPPGFRGMTPNLALTYTGDQTVGLAGRGFELSGLSRIHRCGGARSYSWISPRALTGFSDDDLCLDGQRLVLVDGKHGAVGATYRTEIDAHTKIVATGDCSAVFDAPNAPRSGSGGRFGGPCEFEATFKDGQKAWFGGHAARACSAINTTWEPADIPPRIDWPIVRMSDRASNKMYVRWRPALETADEAASGDSRICIPDMIEYGVNTLDNRDSDRRVRFEYADLGPETRQVQFQAGVRRARFQYLRRIVTEVGRKGDARTVKTYELELEKSHRTRAPRLAQITECGDDATCLPPTRLRWSNDDWLDQLRIDSNADFSATRGMPDARHAIIVKGDFDGDGRPDFLTKQTTSLAGVFYLYQSKMTTPHPYHWNFSVFPNPITPAQAQLESHGYGFRFGGPSAGDVNGDGFDDLILPVPGGYHLYFGSATGLPTSPSETHAVGALSSGVRRIVGDFDGDAQADLLLFDNHFNWTLWEYTPALPNNGFQLVNTGRLPLVGSVPDFDEVAYHDDMLVHFRTGDFNGDGRLDLLAFRRVFLGYAPIPSESDYTSVDEDDRLAFWHDHSTYTYGYAHQILVANDSHGFDSFGQSVWPHASLGVQTGDFNGDGLSDLVLSTLTGSILSFSTGHHMSIDTNPSAGEYPFASAVSFRSGSLRGSSWTPTIPGLNVYSNVYVGDLDGDGRSDVVGAYRWGQPDDPNSPYDDPYSGVRVFTPVGANARRNVAHLQWIATRGNPVVDQGRLIVADTQGRGVDSVVFSRPYSPGVSVSGGRVTMHNEPIDVLEGIVDGLGKEVEVEYVGLGQTVYDRGSTLAQPSRRIQPGMRVVDTLTVRDAQSGQTYRTQYDFDEGAFHRNGRGFLGFGRVRERTPETVEITTHRLDFPYAGLIAARETQWLDGGPYDWSGPTLRRVEYGYAHNYTQGQAQDIWLTEEVTQDFHVTSPQSGSAPGNRSTIMREYDGFGNVLMEVTDPDTSTPGDEVYVISTYDNDVNQHILGLLRERETSFGGAHVLRERFDYDSHQNPTFHGTYDAFYARYLGVEHVYDRLGNVVESIAPDGGRTVYVYGANDMDVTITDPAGLTTQKRFAPGFGVETERVDVNGLTTTFVLDGFGRTTSVRGPNETGAGWTTLKRLERLSLWRNANFEVFDEAGQLQIETVEVPNGYVLRTRTLEAWGQTSDPDMRLEEELHDTLDRARQVRKVMTVDGVTNGPVDLWVQTDLHYDEALPSRLKSESRPFYSSHGNPIFTHYVYDGKGRAVTVYRPDGQANQFVYDDTSRQMARFEPGNATLVAVDGRGNLIAKQTANGGLTEYEYDNLSRLTEVTDPAGVTTAVSYDSVGRKDYVTHSDTGTTQLTYDAEGHLVSEIDPKGQLIVRTFDPTDRTTERLFFDGGNVLERTIRYTYDEPTVSFGAGRLTRVRQLDGGGTVEREHRFGYDVLGRQDTVTVEADGMSMAFGYTFSPSGEPLGMTYPDGSRVRYQRLRGGLLKSIDLDDTQSAIAGFRELTRFRAYDAEGRPEIEVRANDTAVCHRYEAATGRLLRQNVAYFPGTVPADPCGHVTQPSDEGYAQTNLLDVELQWEVEGRIGAIVDHIDASRTQTFGYDAVGQLTSASAPGLYGQRTFGHDAAGNRTSVDGVTQTFSGHRLTGSSAGLSVSWDANGNMRQQQVAGSPHFKSLEWTVDDRLASVTTASGITRFDYDFTGHRVYKSDSTTGNQTWYFAPEFEITELAGGQRLATKRVPGPTGVIAQVTHPWSAPTQQMASLVWHETSAAQTAQGDLLGRALSQAHATTAALARLDVAATTADAARALSLAALLLGLGLWAARRLGRLGRLGRRETRSGGWRVGTATVSLVAFLGTFGLGEVGAQAAMTPGPHGPGVPTQAGLLFLYGDHVGSTSLVVSDGPNVSVVSRYHYRPFGGLSSASTGSDQVREKLHGHELDASSELYYAHERYMDPELGIFVSADTSIGAKPLDALSQHRYAFAANNPVSYRDPSGRFALTTFIVGVAVAAVAGALIGGTQGKILTDPKNAFDNWSWKGAAAGAAIGAVVAATGFGLSAAGSAVSIGAFSMKGALTSMWSTAVIRGTMAYAHGADGAEIAKAAGIGAISGFIAGSGFFGLAGTNEAGAWMAQHLSALADTALKLAANQDVSVKISLWVFKVTIDNRGKAKFGVDYGFLAKKGLSLLGDLRKEQKWGKPMGNLLKSVGKNVKTTDELPDGAKSWFGVSNIVRKAATGELGLFESAADLARSLTGFGASAAKKTQFVNDLLFLGTIGVDGAKAGAEKGIQAGLCAVDPKATGC